MNKKILVYIPTALNTPETEILLSVAQDEINKKNNVEVLTCRGGKNYYCSKNIYSINLICLICKKKTKEALNHLEGKFTHSYTPIIFNKKVLKLKKFNFNNVINYTYNGCDNGLSSYGSYVGITRDKDLDGFFSERIIKNLINTSDYLTDFFYKFIKNKNHSAIYMFNGRMNTYRPLLRVAKILKKNINNLEFNGNRNQVFNFKDALPIDQSYIAHRVNSFWKKKRLKNLKLIDDFINSQIKNQTLVHQKQFKVKQELNKLPQNWNKKKRNIVYFASSGDESLTGGKTYFFKIFKDQVSSISYIYKMIKKNDSINTDFWIRMHPRMTGFKWPFLKNLYELKKKYPSLKIIYPNSTYSSYAMLKESSLVISPVSSLSIQALYFKKPSINFQEQPFVLLKGSYLPKNKKELLRLIFNKNLKPRSNLAQQKYHLFYLDGGKNFKKIKGSFDKDGYKYNGRKIDIFIVYKLIYNIGKVIEVIFSYLNYSFYRLFKN